MDHLLPDQGHRAEEWVRTLAGGLGVPDFVYRPQMVATGSGSREIGDALLVAGEDGLVVQVKSRDPVAGRGDDDSRAEGWARKEGRRGRRQGLGTRRRISRGDVSVTSVRGHARKLPNAEDWPIVVILRHPANPSVDFSSFPDTLFLSDSDWLGLHAMVRSTMGVISYVRRALDSGVQVPLGRESDRYRKIADADVRWSSLSSTSVPVLPPEPLDDEELYAAAFYSELIEKIADQTAAGWDPETYLLFVEVLDRTPALARVQIGRKMIKTFKAMVAARSRRSFFTLDRGSGAKLAVLYDYDDGTIDDPDGRSFGALIASYAALRHNHGIEAGLDQLAPTLGVGIQHRPGEGRRYSFALWKGPPIDMPEDIRGPLERDFGIFDGERVIDPSPRN